MTKKQREVIKNIPGKWEGSHKMAQLMPNYEWHETGKFLILSSDRYSTRYIYLSKEGGLEMSHQFNDDHIDPSIFLNKDYRKINIFVKAEMKFGNFT